MFLIFFSVSSLSANGSTDDCFNKETKIDKFICNASLIKGKSLREIRSIGKLNHEFTENKPNSHNANKIDTFITLQFDGLKIYGCLKSQNEVWPIRVIVTKPQWKISDGLEVGVPNARLTEVLGDPKEQGKNFKKYCGETDCVTFYIKNGAIVKVEFDYYVD